MLFGDIKFSARKWSECRILHHLSLELLGALAVKEARCKTCVIGSYIRSWERRVFFHFMSFRDLVYQSVSQVNFMWCVFHNVQWYWSDNLCKLVTDQWRGSLGGRDSEICWFTEEIGTYMRCWESPGDLPLAKRHN
jgi:hypothetical protein